MQPPKSMPPLSQSRPRLNQQVVFRKTVGVSVWIRALRWWMRGSVGKTQFPAPAVTPRAIGEIEASTEMDFVEIPAGEFLMGSEKGPREWEDERPVHRVSVSAFRMGRYPVTNADYARFMAAHPGTWKPQFWHDRRFNDPRQPVVGVDWMEAITYCRWLGGRLPTEAEWERACRAGTTTEYAFGNQLRHGMANFRGEAGTTTPVDRYPANPWGLHDMHGNVWEWCVDWYDPSYYGRSPAEDPTGHEWKLPTYRRVIRGGAWHRPQVHCRSAARDRRFPDRRTPYLGFRVVIPLKVAQPTV